MALSASDIQTVYTFLTNSLSPDQSVRKPAEAALAQCDNRPGFCSCLLEIIAARDAACREDVRLMASVFFKNSINRYWRHRRDSPGISNDEKVHLRKNLLLHIREENSQIALQLAVLISKIARIDYPKEWPELFSNLAQQLQTADMLASHRLFMVLFRTLKELSTKRLSCDQRNFSEMQLRDAVAREDYADAAKLKLAISGAEKNDSVGSALSDLSRAIEEERYKDAAFLRDHAGVGLVGWWAGISEDSADPYGRIIHISAEHGKYVAKSYSSRQLTSARPGFPLFEIYFTIKDGQYEQQAVYLKRGRENSGGSPQKSVKKSDFSSLNQSGSSTEEQSDIYTDDIKTSEEKRDDDSDVSDGLAGIQNVLRDMIPGVKVKVLKVVSPGKVDRDLIAKVIEQIMEEEDESTDDELEGLEAEDVRAESDIEIEDIEADAEDATSDATEKQNEISVKLVIGTLMQNISADLPPKDVVRVPAKLEKKDRLSFLFSIEQDDKQHETKAKEQALQKRVAALSAQQSYNVMSDLAKVFTSKEKVPMKVLKDVGELISLTMNQNQNHQSLSGSTCFNRIDITSTRDPLSGLYVGAHGMYTSEILHLKHKFGQWQEDDANMKHTNMGFYEYVEAYKLTGSVSVPAGQVAFRAKVGNHCQLPHKGIIPEEFGVIARYKGQGRIADPGFRNPRWVDGELVILDGKYIRGGPVIGFVYWAPEYHFLVFFNRLRLPE